MFFVFFKENSRIFKIVKMRKNAEKTYVILKLKQYPDHPEYRVIFLKKTPQVEIEGTEEEKN